MMVLGVVVASGFDDTFGGFDVVKTPDHVFLFYGPNDLFRLVFSRSLMTGKQGRA